MIILVNCKYICKRVLFLHLHSAFQETKGQSSMCAGYKQRKPFSNNTLVLKYKVQKVKNGRISGSTGALYDYTECIYRDIILSDNLHHSNRLE
jgi:hypothetical protein